MFKLFKPDVAILYSKYARDKLCLARDLLNNLPFKVLILTVHDNDELIGEIVDERVYTGASSKVRLTAISYLRLKLCSRTKPSIQQRRRLPLTDRERATPETPRRV